MKSVSQSIVRQKVDLSRLMDFIEEVGRLAQGPGRVYLVGGATALLLGIRDQTIDVDLKLDPEPKAIFEGISILKERMSINIELASPDQFIPAIPGWRDRSIYIKTVNGVEFFHYDLYGQALAKILRGHQSDLSDARAYVKLGNVVPAELAAYFNLIKSDLIRYPATDANSFEKKVHEFIRSMEKDAEQS